jgi:hypothetical protein
MHTRRKILAFGAAAAATGVLGLGAAIPDTTEPWRRSPATYGLRVTSAAMSPALEPGDIVWLNPAVVGYVGDTVLLGRTLGVLIEATRTHWIIRQHGPGADYVRRADFPHPLKVLGVEFARRGA